MNEILAITAFFMALGAVYLASDGIRKAEKKSEAIVKSHVDQLKGIIDQHTRTLNQQTEDLSSINKTLKESSEFDADIKERLEKAEMKLNQLKAEIAALDNDIKPQARLSASKSK